MTKHITKIRPSTQIRKNDIDGQFIKDGTIFQQDIAIGTFTGDVFLDGSIASAKLVDGHKLMFTDGSSPQLANLDMGGFRVTNLAAAVDAADAVTKNQLDAVVSEFTAFEWQSSAKAIEIDPAALTPSVGDRYLIRGIGAGPWVGHDNQIAQFTGVMSVASGWKFITPTLGTVISVDGIGDRFYLWGGANWEEKWLEVTTASTGLEKVGFDIRIDPLAAGEGLAFNAGVLSINPLAAGSGLDFNGGVLSIAQGNGILVSDNGVAVDAGYEALKIPQYGADGRLGVGNNAPQYALDVTGDIQSSLSVRVGSDLHVTGISNLNSEMVLLAIGDAVAADATHGVVYFNALDNRLHLRTVSGEQVIGAEEGVVVGEEPVGSKDGVNVSFTLDFEPIENSEAVYVNGVRETRGIGYIVNAASKEIVFADAPLSNHIVIVDYRHEVLI